MTASGDGGIGGGGIERLEDLQAVERQAMADMSRAASDDLKRALDIRSDFVDGAFMSLAANLPTTAITINRTMGLGFDGPPTRAQVTEIVRRYREAGVTRFFIGLSPRTDTPEMTAWLTGLGLVEARTWKRFWRGTAPPPEITTDLEVVEAGPEHAEAMGRIAAEGFELGSAGAPLFAQMVGHPGWTVFVALDGDRVVATGSLIMRGTTALLDWGATAPEARGRGAQGALMAARIAKAMALGADIMTTETGEEAEGDEQISWHNIVKMGFEPYYTLRNFAPPKA